MDFGVSYIWKKPEWFSLVRTAKNPFEQNSAKKRINFGGPHWQLNLCNPKSKCHMSFHNVHRFNASNPPYCIRHDCWSCTNKIACGTLMIHGLYRYNPICFSIHAEFLPLQNHTSCYFSINSWLFFRWCRVPSHPLKTDLRSLYIPSVSGHIPVLISKKNALDPYPIFDSYIIILV